MSNISRFIGNERGDKICHEDDGCPTELAVLKRFWREQQASTLPEEVANLVELLDEEEVPYEDSLGVALSLTGRTKQYANGKTATLREQVEKLKKERNAFQDQCIRLKNERAVEKGQLAALAAQNEKMREALAECEQALDECRDYPITYDSVIEALSLPNLASPMLNRIKAEGMRMAAEIVENTDVYTFVHGGRSYDDGGITLSAAATAIRAKADELEQSNG